MPITERFTLEETTLQARMDELSPAQKRVLAWIQMEFRSRRGGAEADITKFFLPFAEMGMDFPQIKKLAEKIPAHYPLDHRHIYFDFRLQRWMRVIEPPTLRECLEDYLQHAPSRSEALAYIDRETKDFLRTRGADWTMFTAVSEKVQSLT